MWRRKQSTKNYLSSVKPIGSHKSKEFYSYINHWKITWSEKNCPTVLKNFFKCPNSELWIFFHTQSVGDFPNISAKYCKSLCLSIENFSLTYREVQEDWVKSTASDFNFRMYCSSEYYSYKKSSSDLLKQV